MNHGPFAPGNLKRAESCYIFAVERLQVLPLCLYCLKEMQLSYFIFTEPLYNLLKKPTLFHCQIRIKMAMLMNSLLVDLV